MDLPSYHQLNNARLVGVLQIFQKKIRILYKMVRTEDGFSFIH